MKEVAEQLRIHPSHVWNTVDNSSGPLLKAFRCGNCGCAPFMQNRATAEAAVACVPKKRKPRDLDEREQEGWEGLEAILQRPAGAQEKKRKPRAL